ncbi:MAG: membrane protein required for colicin V production [Pseudohongiellaceae bacterium]|jgi:membrane protein required for colicin V production
MAVFNWADWTIIVILSLSCAISLVRGFVKEALSVAIWIIAFGVASWFSPKLAPLLTVYIDAISLRQMVAFASLFVATLLVGGAVNYLLSTLIRATGLSGTDRLLGVLFGAIRGFVVIMVIVLYLPKMVPVDRDLWWSESRLISHFLSFEDKFRTITGSLYESGKKIIQ